MRVLGFGAARPTMEAPGAQEGLLPKSRSNAFVPGPWSHPRPLSQKMSIYRAGQWRHPRPCLGREGEGAQNASGAGGHPCDEPWEEEQAGGKFVGSRRFLKAKLMGMQGPEWKGNVQGQSHLVPGAIY